MRVTGFVVLACLALAGCGELEETMIREDAREAVKGALLDGDRAIFTEWRMSGGGAVCGVVNAPNRFGGMTGPQRFVVLADGTVILEERHSAAFLDDIDALAGCQR